MGEISGVPGRLYKEYRVKRQETENMLIDLAEGLATQCVDEVKGRIVPEIEKLNNENQRLVNLNYELIERVRLEEEKRRVLLEQKEEVDRRQEQSVEKYSEVEKSLSWLSKPWASWKRDSRHRVRIWKGRRWNSWPVKVGRMRFGRLL